MGEVSLIRLVARLAPLLAPIPSAFFIGRSIYYYLLFQWHLDTGDGVNLAVAIIAGLAIELLAISSVFIAFSLYRWNGYGHVRKESNPWERAPFGVSLAVTMVYFLVAIYLLVVLEAVPGLARFSAIAFPVLAGVGAINWALFQQHQDRLDRYGLKWTFKAVREVTQPAQRPEPVVKYVPDKTDKVIMTALIADPSMSYSQVARQTGFSKSTVGNRVLKLKQAKLITDRGGSMRVKWGGNGTG